MVQKAARSSNLSFEGNNAENKMSLDEEICEIKLTQQNIYILNSSSDTEENH
jgi:hypothetical protein